MDMLTRAGLANAVWREVGLPRAESDRPVETAIGEMTGAMAAGKKMTILYFGSFVVRAKGPRRRRNPKIGEPAPVTARRVVAFRLARALRAGVNRALSERGRGGKPSLTWPVKL